MTRITDMRGDLQTESSGWLFKSPLAVGGDIMAAPLQTTQLVISTQTHAHRPDSQCAYTWPKGQYGP